MDIRNFFQKNASSTSAASSKPKQGTTATASSTTTASTASTASTSTVDNKKRIKLDKALHTDPVETSPQANQVKSIDEVVVKSSSLLSSQKKQSSPVRKIPASRRKIVIEDSDDDDHDDDDDDEDKEMDMDDPDDSIMHIETTKKSSTKRGSTTTSNNNNVTKKRGESKKKVVLGSLPPIKPKKSIPSYSTQQATPGVLNGLNFVLTGVLNSIGREDAEDYIKILGGKITATVSGKTNYLICGSILEDGRPVHEGSKYKKAKELGEDKVAILLGGEGELYALVEMLDQTLKGNTTMSSMNDTRMDHLTDHTAAAITNTTTVLVMEQPLFNTTTSATCPNIKPIKTQIPLVQQNKNPYSNNKVPPINPYAKKTTAPTDNMNISSNTNTNVPASTVPVTTNPYAKKTNTTTTVKPVVVPLTKTADEDDSHALWTDKYAPTTSDKILGNKDCITKLSAWLNRWEDTFIPTSKGGKKISLGNPQGPFKAALLSGPPGIGKSTTANLVAKETGRQVLEWNASDTRSKKSLAENLGDVTGSQVLSFLNHRSPKSQTKTKSDSNTMKRCIIMDEVDGMGAGDRSGMAELIKMIKNSKVPIICICNERQSPKIKSLAAYCLDLRFRRPVKTVIARKAIEIGEKEGLYVEQNAAEAISESCGNDVRQVINCLQMWASKKGTESMTFKAVRERENQICKDEILRVSMFDATRMIVEGRRGIANTIGSNKAKAEVDSLFQRNDAYFSEYSLMGLNVHQNYLQIMIAPFQETKRRGDINAELLCLNRMVESTVSMSDYAVVDHAVMSGDQQWGLLPLCAILCIKAGYHAGGENGGFLPGFPEFAGWLGKNSTKGKMKRLLQELRHHMNFNVSGDISELRLLYIPSFRERFLTLLMSEEPQISVAIDLMDEYGLDRDDLFENLDEFTLESKPRKMADMDSKMKASFTREYNKGSHKSQALVDEQGVTKTRRKKAVNEGGEGDDVEGLDGINDDNFADDEEDNDDEEENPEQILKLFKSNKKAGKATKTEMTVASKEKGKKK